MENSIFYNGRPCPKGHGTLRYKSGSSCVSCVKIRVEARNSTPEYKEYQARWRRERRANNPGSEAAVRREKYQKDDALRERLTKNARDWWRENRASRSAARIKKYSDMPYKAKRERSLMALYGITHDEYEDMYNKQKGCCAICSDEKEVLAVDHNHDTGRVRGLLCNSCNLGIGMLKDDPKVLLASARYLIEDRKVTMANRPKTLSAYLRSQQDKREDAANARIVGMPVAKFKATAQAKEIDRQIVELNRKMAKKK